MTQTRNEETQLSLPALDGRKPLGFLAACGMLLLLTRDSARPPRLSWSPTSASAQLELVGERSHGTDGALEHIVARIHEIALGIGPGGLLPGLSTSLPIWKGGPRNDPQRVRLSEFRDSVEHWRREAGAQVADAWVPAMVSDQAADGDSVVTTPFAAHVAQQTFSTMFSMSLRMVQKDSDLILQALTSWRRVEGVTGEYLDHHVLNNPTDRSDGQKKGEIGVPGATWLALMALPLFPVWGKGTASYAGGWQRVGRRRLVAWPLWREPLDLPSLTALVAHPDLRLRDAQGTLTCDASNLSALGVFRVCAAERRKIPARKFAGVLTPVPVAQVVGRGQRR